MNDRTLAVEFVAFLVLETVAGIRSDGIPKPSRYVGGTIAFAMLGLLAAFGPEEARLAGAFGGVVLLAILLSPSVEGVPKAVSVARGLASAAGSSAQVPPGTPTTVGPPGSTGAFRQ